MAGLLWSTPNTLRVDCRRAEQALLESVPWDGASFVTKDVAISHGGREETIHTIIATGDQSASIDPSECCPIVLWAGFGQGPASYFQNLPGLARGHNKGPVYTVEWLGIGLSSRPPWTAGDDPEAAEEFFATALEAWRVAMVGFLAWL